MYQEKIGIVGGFGAYATLDFYRRLLELFASESERNYPHIIMDLDFTMPSRTRALLYDESYDEVVNAIAHSFHIMLENHVDKIIMVCGTAHYFLDDVYRIIPQAKEKVINIIDCLGNKLQQNGINQVLIIAAEGTLKKELYPHILSKYNVNCISPQQGDYQDIRCFIESVKRNDISIEIINKFKDFLDKFAISEVVLGCTEFPLLVAKTKLDSEYHFYDPLEITLQELKKSLK